SRRARCTGPGRRSSLSSTWPPARGSRSWSIDKEWAEGPLIVEPASMAKPRSKPPGPAPIPEQAAGRKPADRLLLTLLAVAVAASFHEVLSCDFVNWDDDIYVYDNPHPPARLSGGGLRWAFTGVRGGYWIPLTWLSLLADYQLYGLRPWGYHLTNLALHVANALLAYLLFRRWTGQPSRSFVAAALFALHP